MSWKLIFGLSLSGIVMGIATVFLIPPHLEPHCWFGVLVITGYMIAKYAPDRYFAHGLCVGLVASLWVALAHYALADRYLAIHGRLLALAPPVASPPVLMALAGGAAGIAASFVLGIYAWVNSKYVVSAHSEFAGW